VIAGDRLQHCELVAKQDFALTELDEFARARLKRPLLLLKAAIVFSEDIALKCANDAQRKILP
jgi:hypothetical protein